MTYVFKVVPIKMTEQQLVHSVGDGHGRDASQLFFAIELEGSHGRLKVDQWLLSSCAAMGLSRFNYISWPAEAVPDFLKFLSTLTHWGDYVPKKFYFCVKVTDTYQGGFICALKQKARLVDTFKNKAHKSVGDLGLYTLEFPENAD